jgi:DNA adenine methylase
VTAPTRPVLRYHGGKWRLAPWIISHFPAHSRYVEPFGGAASVLVRKDPVDCEVYNDLDAELVNVFRVLRDPILSEQLRVAATLTPYARDEYELSYATGVSDPVEAARRTVFRAYASFGGCGQRRYRTGMRPALGGRGNRPELDWRGWPSQVTAFCDRLSTVQIENVDALKLVEKYDRADTLFFIDPPYPHSTRSMVQTASHFHYAVELTDDDHRRLAAVQHRCEAAVVVSGYACPLYDDELYSGWTRSVRAARANGGKPRTEVVWLNPACAAALAAERELSAAKVGT